MKKIIKIILVPVFLIGFTFSCSEDFLEEQPNQFISQGQITDIATYDPSILDGFLSGTYSTTVARFLIAGGNHFDFGQRGVDVITDMLSSDMVLGGLNFGWYTDVTNYGTGLDFSNAENLFIWSYYYSIIFAANNVIDGFGGSDAVPDNDEARYSLGQALAMRAYAYFYLSQIFQEDYDPNEAVIPLYDTVTGSGPAAPMSEVFALIESDLSSAISFLEGFNRSSKVEVNEYVAKGFLAYAYAAQGKYDLALPVCDDIINNGGFVPVSGSRLTSGFNDIGDPGWMWGVDLLPVNNHNLVSWWGKNDIFSFSYAWAGDIKPIDEALYNSMRPDDMRRYQFGECDESVLGTGVCYGNDPHGYGDYVPTQKFYNPDRIIGGSSADNNVMDYVFMRVAEFHLLAAESAYKSGAGDGLARQYLNNLVSLRVDDPSYLNSLTGQALMDEISLQTRLELWGEGKSYLLMKRNDETRTRGTNHILLAGESIAHNEPRVTVLIPQDEIINNPFLD